MANIYGYIRVSTRDQNEDRQLIALRELKIPEKNIFMDTPRPASSTPGSFTPRPVGSSVGIGAAKPSFGLNS